MRGAQQDKSERHSNTRPRFAQEANLTTDEHGFYKFKNGPIELFLIRVNQCALVLPDWKF
jgi:hypothetical protein